MALKILCKSSSKYLEILVVATGASTTVGFVFEGLVGWSDNLLSDLGGREESGGGTEGATEGRPRPQTEVILKLISSKNIFPNGLADPLDIEKLEL